MYEPAEDSFLLKECVSEFCKGKKLENVLDMGTGTGIQGFSMVDYTEFVLACDIDKEACKLVKDEIIEKGLSNKMESICSDLFSNVPRRFQGKFDLMMFNAPYLSKGEDDYADTELYGGAFGIHVTEKFLEQAKEFLSEAGVIFFVASSLAKLELLEKFMTKQNYNFEIIKKKHISFEDIIVYKAWL